ncbi:FCD domain-containing protein [Pseudodesulfovibrio thermohalotolerans]|uniref:FadR/GntR family transcriptional regulator n=1 Tax=Pseudodesulfovibrio thermohalotolerans TaxID=2880651 RepID=UPI002441C981|nr:FCD domain-containing protein [Pseudodesulfovibrio thermohalotolerans]WFS63379.1 FCD domain-containing protein [Pseudodesulfovibrio thermohalotolerans]
MPFKNREEYGGTSGHRQSRTETAVHKIESLILQNEWGDGERLPSQRALAEELGVSRPTIREALVSMEARGRLVIQPAKGVFLSGPGTASGKESATGVKVQASANLSGRESQMYQFRYAIEPAIAGLVAVNATAAQVEDMRVVVASMRRALESRDIVEFSRLDFTFHSQMIEAANNRFFTEAITPFLGLFFESQTLPLTFDESVQETVREHEEIMEHIREGRSAEARKSMEWHVRCVARRAGVNLIE